MDLLSESTIEWKHVKWTKFIDNSKSIFWTIFNVFMIIYKKNPSNYVSNNILVLLFNFSIRKKMHNHDLGIVMMVLFHLQSSF